MFTNRRTSACRSSRSVGDRRAVGTRDRGVERLVPDGLVAPNSDLVRKDADSEATQRRAVHLRVVGGLGRKRQHQFDQVDIVEKRMATRNRTGGLATEEVMRSRQLAGVDEGP